MFSDFSDVEDGEILFSEPEEEQGQPAQEPAGNDVSVSLKTFAKTEAEILDLKIKQAEESYRVLYNKYVEKVRSKHTVAVSHNHPGYYTAKTVLGEANPTARNMTEKDLPRTFDLTVRKKTPEGSKLTKAITSHVEKDTLTDNLDELRVVGNLTGGDKQRDSDELRPACTEQTISLGQPRGRPTLLVKFFDLDEEEVHLAETLCGFDQEQGDLLGDLQRNGVRVGIYIKIVHCQARGEVYKLKDMLNGINGTFCGSTITLEIRY